MDGFRIPEIAKDHDLFFVGRMVSDKGIDILIDALHHLRQRGLRPSLTLVGGGPEELLLQDKVKTLGLSDSVRFAGQVGDAELNELLNAYRIMVVPTRHGEGFGVVALEGIACGCVVVGSTCGGLPEAIGACGTTFPNMDPTALADVLFDLLTHRERLDAFRAHASQHLQAHKPAAVAQKYLEVLLPLVR
jgi:glycogen(starch) synthase